MKNWNLFARVALLEIAVDKLTQLAAPPAQPSDAVLAQRKARQKEYSRKYYAKRKAAQAAKGQA
jgi:hypothetical protein